MSVTTVPQQQEQENYLTAGYSLKSWFLTYDHKRIAWLYLASITAMFFIGGIFAALMRLELMTPASDLFEPDNYNKLFTMHGIVMVFFFIIPAVPAVLGNFLLPLMLGAKDVAFPKLNLLSWYVYIAGATFTIYTIVAGGVDTGWTFYTPYSTSSSQTHVVPVVLGLFITGFSSILTGLNFMVTIHRMRAPGLTWFRLPLMVWSLYATSIIQILGTPVIAVTLMMAGLEKIFKLGIFDPALGGDPVLFQHLFWFYSHPAVYIMIVPGMGVINEVVTCFSRRSIFGYRAIAFANVGFVIFSFVVWGHHMIVAGQSVYSALIFSILSYLVGIFSAIKVFNWTATMYKGSISYDTPMLYVFGFQGLFLIGGLTGLFLSALGFDVHVHDTYFVVAHFHYVMVGGLVMAFMAGIHFWWPKMTGKMYPESIARFAMILVFSGFNLTFFPQFVLGYLGMPRRYASYTDEFQLLNIMSTAGGSVLGLGFLLAAAYMVWSLFYGKAVNSNPWKATGLEWEKASSPPIVENFHETPVVTEDPYNYANRDFIKDFPQELSKEVNARA